MPDPVSVRPVAADDAERPRAPGRDLAGRLPAKAFYEARGWERDGAAVTRDFAGAEPAVVRYRRSL